MLRSSLKRSVFQKVNVKGEGRGEKGERWEEKGEKGKNYLLIVSMLTLKAEC